MVTDLPCLCQSTICRRITLAQAKRVVTAQLPWPLAMLTGMCVGALAFFIKNRGVNNSEEVRYPVQCAACYVVLAAVVCCLLLVAPVSLEMEKVD